MNSTYLILEVTMILMSGVFLHIIKNQQMEVEKGSIQIVVLLIILPAVMMLATQGVINSDTISILLGAVVGYFFRYSQSRV